MKDWEIIQVLWKQEAEAKIAHTKAIRMVAEAEAALEEAEKLVWNTADEVKRHLDKAKDQATILVGVRTSKDYER